MIIPILFILTTFLYAIYIQFSKSMGNIWLRTNSNGNISFRPYNLLIYMINPLYKPFMWNYKLLDINYY